MPENSDQKAVRARTTDFMPSDHLTEREAAKSRALAMAETMTDEEDAALTRAAESDPDNPPIPVGAKFVTFQEARRRGRPRVPSPKRQVTLRLDGEVVDGMRALGDGWQVRVNAVLKDWLKQAG